MFKVVVLLLIAVFVFTQILLPLVIPNLPMFWMFEKRDIGKKDIDKFKQKINEGKELETKLKSEFSDKPRKKRTTTTKTK